MSALNKSQKFVRLLERMQLPGGVVAVDAMADLDLDSRTLRRYLADLRGLDIPVLDEGRGIDRVLRVDPAWRRRHGVELTLLEVVSLRFGRTLFNFLGGTQFAADMDDALERLSPVIRRKDAARVRELDRKLMAVPEPAKDHAAEGDLLDEILSALLYENPAQASYARIGGAPKRYDLHPYTLATYRQGLYLFALDLHARKVKTFALDRFVDFRRARGEHFVYPKDYDPQSVIADAFGILGGPVVDVELHFRRDVAPYIRERRWHATQVLREGTDGAVVLTMRVAYSAELVSWVLGFGPQVRVQAPKSLRDEVQRLHAEAARA